MDAVNGIEEFVNYVVTGLADRPDQANITRRQDGEKYFIDVRVAEDDMARLLGRGGNTVMAVRNLASAAGACQGVDVGVEVIE